MFKVETSRFTERYCPNGHELLPQNDHQVKFCHICGAPVRERLTVYDAAICANCNNQVDPTWNYCPYCGQARK